MIIVHSFASIAYKLSRCQGSGANMKKSTKRTVLREKGIYLLPNLFTLSALFLGFYAIIAAIQGRYVDAAIAIFIGMVMDGLDGRVARLTHTQTAFGADLDSLSDMVTFGVAPALVMYLWQLHSFGKLGWAIAFLYAVSVALRLARFNNEPEQDLCFFKGLSCPPAAGVLAGILWNVEQLDITFIDSFPGGIILMATMFLLSVFMVSTMDYPAFKNIGDSGKVSFKVIIAVVLAMVTLAIEPAGGLLLLFAGYALYGPVMWVVHKLCAVSRS
jgi:CDP-diacylglycerol---serine O-phosphatidyltransferase